MDDWFTAMLPLFTTWVIPPSSTGVASLLPPWLVRLPDLETISWSSIDWLRMLTLLPVFSGLGVLMLSGLPVGLSGLLFDFDPAVVV